MTGPSILNPAGGVRYHWRALRYGARLWQPFRWALGEWLLGWHPPETTLLVVGPSGGYCMQPFLFERFERVVCLEPDPVARWVFRRRLLRAPLERQPRLEFVNGDHLLTRPEELPKLLDSLGSAAVLFSNVLGQLRALLDVDAAEGKAFSQVRQAVQSATAVRSWASFHDRVSGPVRPAFRQPMASDGRLSDAELLEAVYGETTGSHAGVAEYELLDHLTDGFFPAELPHTYFSWELEPSIFHLIEGVSSPTSTLVAELSATQPE